MLPASHRGSGQSIGFPDVCNTPVGAATVPIPYVNLADHTQAVGFSTIVSVAGTNALHLGTSIPMTSGDEAGTAHSTIKGKGAFTSGNPVVFIENQPAITLTSPTTGNAMNNGVGAVTVPGAATVTFTRRGAELDAPIEPSEAMELATALAADIEIALRTSGAIALRLAAIGPRAPAQLWRVLCALAADVRLILDLRGNPGGDLEAMRRLAEELLPRGAPLLRYREGEGVERLLACRHGGDIERELAVLVDGGTASAAELFAAALQHHGRARIVGERTFGKATAQRLICSPHGSVRYATVGSCRLPDGSSLEGVGVVPDVATSSDRALAVALEAG